MGGVTADVSVVLSGSIFFCCAVPALVTPGARDVDPVLDLVGDTPGGAFALSALPAFFFVVPVLFVELALVVFLAGAGAGLLAMTGGSAFFLGDLLVPAEALFVLIFFLGVAMVSAAAVISSLTGRLFVFEGALEDVEAKRHRLHTSKLDFVMVPSVPCKIEELQYLATKRGFIMRACMKGPRLRISNMYVASVRVV